jgi:Tfp pilus assembly protein PilV
MRTSTPRSGSAIIEALIATVMLATAGVALITLLGQTAHSMRTLRNSERLTRDASDRLDRLVLLGRADILAREGRTSFAGWSLVVAPVGPSLFDVSVAPTDTSAVLLRTTIYRPDTTSVDQ